MLDAVERVARAVRWASSNHSQPGAGAAGAGAGAHLSAEVSRYLEAEAEAGAGASDSTPPPEVATFRLWRGDEPLGTWSPDVGLSAQTNLHLLALDE